MAFLSRPLGGRKFTAHRLLLSFLIAALTFLLPSIEAGASSPHYVNGILGLKAATMPPPGHLYYRMYNVYYTADQLRNDDGHKVDIDHFRISYYMMVHSLTYATNTRFLGARLLMDIDIPLIDINYSVENTFGERLPDTMGFHNFTLSKSGASFGLSDIILNPIILAWERPYSDIYFGLSVIMPTGRFSQGDPSSPGKGYWTFMPGLGATVYFDKAKTWSSSVLAHYEISTKQQDTEITPGDHFHFEWGIGKSFKTWSLGVAGYCSWQVTDDTGPGASKKRTRAFAVGPEIDFIVPAIKSLVTIRSLWETGNRNNTQGNITTVSLLWMF